MPLYKEENGTWSFKINYKEDGKYKQKMRRGFDSRGDAKFAMNDMEDQINKGTFIESSKLLYSKFMIDWLEDKKTTVKKSTLTTYSALVKNYIIKSLGELELQKITPRHIQNMYNDLHKSGKLSDENIQKIHTIINESLNKALLWDMVKKNVASLVDRPSATKKKVVVWEESEMHLFLEVAKGSRFYPVYLLALTSGMRQSEILGLRWKDVDFKNNVISITQALSHDGKEFTSGAKTDSGSRTIALDSETMATLKTLKATRAAEKLSAGDLYNKKNDLVIATALGQQVGPRNVLRSFYSIIEKCNKDQEEIRVKEIRFHDMRHTHATMLLKQGVNAKIVSERLGHANVKITLDTYSHVLPSMQKDTADAFGKLFYANSAADTKNDTNKDSETYFNIQNK